jgi:steroid delta-isomerase-like uncharacterized protein
MKLTKTTSIVLFALLLSFTIISCKNETATEPLAEHFALEKAEKKLSVNLKIYETIWDDILNKGEIDKINKANFDTNITAIVSPENVFGIKGFKDYYQNYLTGFSDITFTLVDVFGQGDKIVKHWNFKGTHTGDFFGIPATGKKVNIDSVTLVKMKDGKIAQEQDFMNNLLFNQQQGF